MTKKNVILTAALAAVAGTAGVAVSTTEASAQAAPTHSTSWTGTVGEDRYGDARFKMRGRLQYDIVSSDWDVPGTANDENGTQTQIRRAFLGVQGRLTEQWRYKLDFVLDPGATDATSDVAVDDAYLEYVGDSFSIVIGEHNITSPLEDRISSLDIPFNERSSVINAFGFGRAAGLGIAFGGGNWSLTAAAQGDSLNNNAGGYVETTGTNDANESFSTSARGTWAPIYSRSPEGMTLLHVGASVRNRDLNNAADDSIDVRPLNGRGSTILQTGIDSRQDITYGIELAGQFNQFGFQAEYLTMDVSRQDLTDGVNANLSPEYSGYYVDLHWSLTGEARTYDPVTGSFKAIKPHEGGWGYWGLSARYDSLDLSEGDLTGANNTTAGASGEVDTYALGLTWIPVEHVQFRVNYAHTEADYTRAGVADQEADVISIRSQFDF